MATELKPLDGGTKLVARKDAPDADASVDTLDELMDLCSEGFTFWRAKIQRSDRGRRTSSGSPKGRGREPLLDARGWPRRTETARTLTQPTSGREIGA